MVSAASATGALDRVRSASQTRGRHAVVDLLREIEPSFDAMEAETLVQQLLSWQSA